MDYSEDDYSAKAEEADRLAAEKEAMDDAWKELVTSVLSLTTIDPKDKRKRRQFYQRHVDKVTDEQVIALQHSPYGESFQYIVDLWEKKPREKRPDLYDVIEVFKNFAELTDSGADGLCERQNRYEIPSPSTQLYILSRAAFLQGHFFREHDRWNPYRVSENLNQYIDLDLPSPEVERKLLLLCIDRAAKQARHDKRSFTEALANDWDWVSETWYGVFLQILMKVTGYSLSRFFGWSFFVAGTAAIAILALNYLSYNYSIVPILGLIFVGYNIIKFAVFRGTLSIAVSLRHVLAPPHPEWKKDYLGTLLDTPIPLDLWALDKAVKYDRGHINLRLVRDQLIRLQNTDIDLPVQFITLLDRAIADGEHYW